jgi:hypothetical protein
MTTYTVRHQPGRRTPLAEVMGGTPEAAESRPKRVSAYGPAKSEFRLRCEAMAVGDEIETATHSPKQAQAVASNLRKHSPEVRFTCFSRGTVTVVKRTA